MVKAVSSFSFGGNINNKEVIMNTYKDITNVVEKLIKDTNIPESQQSIVAGYISDEIIRKIDFYTKKFYMIMTKEGKFVRYCTDSTGSKAIFIGMAASSATIFDDIITCNEVFGKCESKYPSEIFGIKSFEY